MTCPKCGSEMRMYERNGVTVDQCTGCRGVFLDRGELERLIDAETSHYGTQPPAPARTDDRPPSNDRSHSDDYYRSKKKKKPGSFLEDLFG